MTEKPNRSDFLEVGQIVNTHGLRGELKVVPWMDSADQFEKLERVCAADRKGEQKILTVEKIRYQKNNLIVKFKEFNDINDAEPYVNEILRADRKDLGELPEGVYYIADLIGLEVADEDGVKLGVIANVINTGANDIYDVKRDGKKNLLLPVIEDVVKKVDIENGLVTVHILEGLDPDEV